MPLGENRVRNRPAASAAGYIRKGNIGAGLFETGYPYNRPAAPAAGHATKRIEMDCVYVRSDYLLISRHELEEPEGEVGELGGEVAGDEGPGSA